MNNNITSIVKKNYNKKISTLLYIEPENFNIKKVSIKKITNNNHIKLLYLYEYKQNFFKKLIIKTNYTELNCYIDIKKNFKNFIINLDLYNNINLKNILHQLDILTLNFLKDNQDIKYNNYITFINNNNNKKSCKFSLYNNSKIIIYNSKNKIQKELEKNNNIMEYDIYTDVYTPHFSNLMLKFINNKKGGLGGYNIKYLLSPKIYLYPENNNIYSNLDIYHAEIKHNKSYILSIVDQEEIVVDSGLINKVEI